MIKANEMHTIAIEAREDATKRRIERTENCIVNFIEPRIKHLAKLGNTHCAVTITVRDVDFTLIEATLKENGFDTKYHGSNKIDIYW